MAGSRPPRALPTTSLGRSAHTNAPHEGYTLRCRHYDEAHRAHNQHRTMERNHAKLGGEAAILKLLRGGKHRARSVRPGSHRTTAAAPCPLNPATSAGQGTPARERGNARTGISEPQPRCCPAAAGPRPPKSACTMLLSGSLAPASRTCAAVGRKELREAQSAPRQRHPSAERKPRTPSASM